eukprot:523338_1
MTKRMDMETKKRVALEHLHESKSVWSPKELPNVWHKKKKISKSAVEKVIEELEYDDSIHQEKIGASKYIWAFKSEQRVENQNKLKRLEQELNKGTEDLVSQQRILEKAKNERKKENREQTLEGLNKMLNVITENEEQISKFQGCDPTKVKEYDEAIETAMNAAERWTDNVFAVTKFIKSKKSNTDKEIFQYFGLPADFDYIESA